MQSFGQFMEWFKHWFVIIAAVLLCINTASGIVSFRKSKYIWPIIMAFLSGVLVMMVLAKVDKFGLF